MFRKAVLYAIFTSAVVTVAAHSTFAQEKVTVQEPEQFDYIIDEALDQVEQSLDSAVTDHAILPDPSLSDVSELKADTEAAVDSQIPEDIIEIPEIELQESVPPSPGDFEEMIEAQESTPQADVPMVLEGLDESEAAAPRLPETLKIKIIPLLHAEAASLVETLNKMKSPAGEVVYSENDRALILKDTLQPLETMEAFIKEVDIPLETEVFQLEHADVEDIIEDIEVVLTENIGQAHSDEEVDSIVITDTPSKIAEIKKLIAALDRFDKDVLIKARVLQIVLNDEHMDGVDWEAIVSEYQELAFSGFDAQDEGRLKLGTVSQEDYDILLEALDTVGIIRTISEGDIITGSGTKKTVDILLEDLKDLDEDDGVSDISLDREDLGSSVRPQGERKIQFSITPTIRRDEPLTVSVEPQLWQGILEKEKAGSGIAAVEVKDGDTMIIGSLFDDTIVESAWKIPLLGDLPLLGFVFRNEGEELRKAEIIIFLTIGTVEKRKNATE